MTNKQALGYGVVAGGCIVLCVHSPFAIAIIFACVTFIAALILFTGRLKEEEDKINEIMDRRVQELEAAIKEHQTKLDRLNTRVLSKEMK